MKDISIVRRYPKGSYIQVGDSTWNKNERSIKYVYMASNGHPARTSPEVPMRILVDMVVAAIRNNELDAAGILRLSNNLNQALQRKSRSGSTP